MHAFIGHNKDAVYWSLDHLFGIVVSTSDAILEVPGSIPGYTVEIFLEV